MTTTPERVLPWRRPLPLLDASASRVLERRVAATLPRGALMRRAGAAVARLALALAPHAETCWIVVGPGGNGGDGLEAAFWLATHGRRVEVTTTADLARLPRDASDALARARDAGVTIRRSPRPAVEPSLAIDALLGLGSNRAPEGELAEAIRTLNGLRAPVLAVDLPSGLDPATGEPFGAACVRAAHTLALLSLKPGLVTGRGRDHAGTLWLDTLGADTSLDPPDEGPSAWLSGFDPAAIAKRSHAQNKGSFGDVAVVGGAAGMTGAAVLASRAASGAGAGRVYVDLLDRSPSTARVDPVRPEIMFRDDWAATAGDALRRATVVCGCGGGRAVRGPLERLLDEASRLVLDADALNAVAADASLARSLQARRERGRISVLTPHPLEAARLLATDVQAVQADRLRAARELVERYACIVVLKGSGTVVAAPGEVPRLNATGNAALATAGTGDVLAGWLAGRWAQRQETSGDPWRRAFEVAVQAVAEHGAAAEPPPPGALRASDLIERLQALGGR